MKLATRQDAISLGHKTYKSTPCKICGDCDKYVSSYSCVSCTIKRSLWKLSDSALMEQYRTKDKVREYWDNHKELAREIDKRYSSTPKGKIANTLKSAKRRARVRNQFPEDADLDKIREIYTECRRISSETGIPHEVDHKIPIV